MRNKNDGHLSSGMCQSVIEDATDIMNQIASIEDCYLPTWWTSKLAVASAYLNSLRDYITYSRDDLLEESEGNETNEEEAAESPAQEAQEMLADVEEFDVADEMLPPSARMMKNAIKAG